MPHIEFKVMDEAGKAVAARGRLHISHASAEKVVEGEGGPAGRLSFVYPDGWTPRLLRFAAISAGYWAMTIPAPPHKSQVQCKRLSSAKTLGNGGWWWHEALNAAQPRSSAGRGIKVGVIDTGFGSRAGLSHVRVTNHKGRAVGGPSGPIPEHGEIICRLIGQRAGTPNRRGLVPGAELTSIAVENSEGKLEFTKVVLAVLHLARDRQVDLINLSAGLFDNPLNGLRSVIQRASNLGTLCIVAAGNEPRPEIAFPACYADCIGVGAIGSVGWGPESSTVHRYGDSTTYGAPHVLAPVVRGAAC